MTDKVYAKILSVLDLPAETDELDLLEAIILLKKSKPLSNPLHREPMTIGDPLVPSSPIIQRTPWSGDRGSIKYANQVSLFEDKLDDFLDSVHYVGQDKEYGD